MRWSHSFVVMLILFTGLNSRAGEIVTTEASGSVVTPGGDTSNTQTHGGDAGDTSTNPVWRPIAAGDVDGTCVTSAYGKRHLFRRKNATFHTGLDFRAASGTSVTAILSGTIVKTGRYRACGLYVEVRQVDGLFAHYCHLSAYRKFAVGERIERGQVLGLTGTTGSARHQPHLHLAMTTQAGFAPGYSVDPMPYFPGLAICINN